MRRDAATVYALSVSLLAAEYVRRTRAADGAAQESGPRVSRAALGALVRFLSAEVQRPLDGDGEAGSTSLLALLSRLERALPAVADFHALSAALVGTLAGVDSPDAVDSAIDRVQECVAPLDAPLDAPADAGAALARQSVLGVFVRRFLLAAGRQLFDGLSRLFDDVQRYVRQFREDCELVRRGTAPREQLQAPTWREGELLLSPIRAGTSSAAAATPKSASPSFQSPNLLASTPLRPPSPRDFCALSSDAGDAALWSGEQLDVILHDAIQRIRKDAVGRRDAKSDATSDATGDATSDTDGSPPASLRVARALISRSGAGDRNALYARYLDRLHRRDYQGALGALHQYHDVVPADHARDRALLAGAAGVDEPRAHPSTHFRGSGVQYAALNLAGLQIAFGHHSAALESLMEAVRVAQHHGDHVCVAFALSWMVLIAQRLGKPKQDVLPLVRSCLERAKELQLPTLGVLAALAETEVELARGSADAPPPEPLAATQLLPHVLVARAPGPQPAELWARLEQSAQDAVSLFVRASPSASQGASGGRAGAAVLQQQQQQQGSAAGAGASGAEHRGPPRGMAWATSGDAVLDAMWEMRSRVHLSSAAAWRLFGSRPLEQALSRMVTACYRDAASLDELTAAVGRTALDTLSDSAGAGDKGANVYLGSLQRALDAVEQLADRWTRRHWVRHASFQRLVHHLLFLLALRRGQHPLAAAHLDVVQRLSPADKDLPASIEAQLHRALLLAETGDCERSLALLKALETQCAQLETAHLLAQVLLAAGKVQLQRSRPHASGAALPAVLKSIDVCKRHHYDLLLSQAHLLMAELLLSMGKAREAHALVRDEMPLVMEHGTVHLRGDAMLLLAKTELSELPQARGASGSNGHAVMARVLERLADSGAMFAASQDVKRQIEVAYLRALVYHHALALGVRSVRGMDAEAMQVAREAASEQFLELRSRLNQARSVTIEQTASFESVQDVRHVISLRSRDR